MCVFEIRVMIDKKNVEKSTLFSTLDFVLRVLKTQGSGITMRGQS